LQTSGNGASSDLPIETPEELVTLASIVEKETARADERTRVAGVFINRLTKACASSPTRRSSTAVYGGEAWMEPRPIYRSQLQDDTNPYNTYTIPRCRRGLSPILDGLLWKRSPIPLAPMICSSLPMAQAGTPLPRPMKSTTETLPGGGRSSVSAKLRREAAEAGSQRLARRNVMRQATAPKRRRQSSNARHAAHLHDGFRAL
jgi:hypothetical protein